MTYGNLSTGSILAVNGMSASVSWWASRHRQVSLSQFRQNIGLGKGCSHIAICRYPTPDGCKLHEPGANNVRRVIRMRKHEVHMVCTLRGTGRQTEEGIEQYGSSTAAVPCLGASLRSIGVSGLLFKFAQSTAALSSSSPHPF